MKEIKNFEFTSSEEYQNYIGALCNLASQYIPEIRRQFAEKALENFQNETIRALVLAYGDEVKKLEADRLRDFGWAAKHPEWAANPAESGYTLEDSCLNNANHYAAAIKLFFHIK